MFSWLGWCLCSSANSRHHSFVQYLWLPILMSLGSLHAHTMDIITDQPYADWLGLVNITQPFGVCSLFWLHLQVNLISKGSVGEFQGHYCHIFTHKLIPTRWICCFSPFKYSASTSIHSLTSGWRWFFCFMLCNYIFSFIGFISAVLSLEDSSFSQEITRRITYFFKSVVPTQLRL